MRGQINNRARGAQVRDYSGLRFGNITPTDIDGVIEYHDKAWIILELKYKTAPLPRGQELALERMCKDLGAQKPSLVIVASHESEPDQDIDGASSVVDKIFYRGAWTTGKAGQTVLQVIKDFIRMVDGF